MATGTPQGALPILAAVTGRYTLRGLWSLPRFLGFVSAAMLAWYVAAMKWELGELARFALGVSALWGPCGALLYLALRAEIPDRTARLTISLIASYAITTLVYFGLAVVRLEPLFYTGLGGAAVGVAAYSLRGHGHARTLRHSILQLRPNFVLVALIAASLLLNIPYKTAYTEDPEAGTRTYLLFRDHLYHVGLAYELARHVPPEQASIRGGSPERAYHLFPHLTTMLLARFTGQADMLRAHLVYHYTVIEVLMCLVLFCIARGLAGSPIAGYVAVSLMYVAAVPWPPLTTPSTVSFSEMLAWPPSAVFGNQFFYFTLFPHASSGLVPVAVASPQMYSGLLVAYGLLLGFILLSVRRGEQRSPGGLLMAMALMTGATMRFRIHVFIVMLPAFVMMTAYLWWRYRDRTYLGALAVVLGVGSLLYLEMRSPVYLPGTASVQFGYNGLTAPGSIVSSWPEAPTVYAWLASSVGDATILRGAWQAISIPAFVALNVLGVPLIVAAGIYFARPSAWRQLSLASALIYWLVAASTLTAMVITTEYDSWSVGGQLLLHTRWYVFPLAAVAAYLVGRAVWLRLGWPRWSAVGLATVAVVLIGLVRLTLTDSSRVDGTRISEEERLALRYLHDETPRDAVVVSNRYVDAHDRHAFWLSGLTGRAAYLEYAANPVEQHAARLFPDERRRDRITGIWAAQTTDAQCAILATMPVTHLVEYAEQPLRVRDAPCMRRAWSSAGDEVTIWERAP